MPVVAYNAAFDLTPARPPSCAGTGCRPCGAAGRRGPGPVIDPYTIDRAVDRYRKGKRTLEAVCAEYGVLLDGAHDAAADALAAARRGVRDSRAARPGRRARPGGAAPRARSTGTRDWAADFQSFLRRKGTPDAVIDRNWPVREPAQIASRETPGTVRTRPQSAREAPVSGE